MRRIILMPFLVLPVLVILFVSCKKDHSCAGCVGGNRSPMAIAGADQLITLPVDSVLLDGSASRDPDGNVSNWLWTKISGPSAFNISQAAAAKTIVSRLIGGAYQFELRVTDNHGLAAKDTVKVIVMDLANSNTAPTAIAGEDLSITLPASSVKLRGDGSSDPENNIILYEWAKISGPESGYIVNALATQTDVINLAEGTYQFQLKVTDAGGLYAMDTVQVLVRPESTLPPTCNNENRPTVSARLVAVGELSRPRSGMSVVAAGNKIFFAGGYTYDMNDPVEYWGTSRVDIFDVSTQTWSTAELSQPRSSIATVASGNKVFFAGGDNGDGAFNTLYSTVDIFDLTTNSWTVASLSEPRSFIGATAVGNKVLFAGGEKDWEYNTSNKVDIYDLQSQTWSVAQLSEARAYVAGVTAGDKAYFAGGHREDRWYADPSDRIDIYDHVSNTWTTSSLSLTNLGSLSAISVADKIYWAGGCEVEIKNLNTWNSSIAQLFKPGGWSITHGQRPVVKDNKIVFFRHSWGVQNNRFDIYDITANSWSIGVLPQFDVGASSIIAVNNQIYIAGGIVGGNISNISKQVWRLDF